MELKTDSRNLQSQQAMERPVFMRKGILCKHMILCDGFIRDTVYYSAIAEEWQQIKRQILQLLASHTG